MTITTRVIHTPTGFEHTEATTVHTRERPDQLDLATSRVYEGATRFTVGQDEAQQESTARYVHSTAGITGGGILATLSSAYGKPSVEIEPGNSASRTDVSTAERLGLIRADGRGGWEEVRSAAGEQRTLSTVEAEQQRARQAQAEQQQNESRDDTEGVFRADEDAQFARIAEGISEPAFRATAALITNAVVLDQGLEAAAQRLAQETGMEPSQALEKVATLVELQQNIVDRAMARVGLKGHDLASFYEHAMSQPGRLNNALQYLTAARDVSQFQSWGREWAEVQGLRTAAKQAAGVGISTDDLASAEQVRDGKRARSGVSQVDALLAAGFEVSHSFEGNLIARKGHGNWVAASAIFNGRNS